MKIARLMLCAAAALLLIWTFPIAGARAEDPPTAVQEQIQSLARSAWVHEGVRYRNVVVYPVSLREVADSTSYTSLDEAIESGLVRITEVGSGSVPTLRMEIRTTEPLFFMAGEVITGAKQDRILRHDMLFRGSHMTIDLPVYCVEQGRWTVRSESFASGGTVGANQVRRAAAMKEGQSEVWRQVSDKNAELDASTSTGTVQAGYASERYVNEAPEYLEHLKDIPALHGGAVSGAIIAIGGKVVSADLFANPTIFRKLWPKILKAAVADALTAPDGAPEGNEAARRFLGIVTGAAVSGVENPSQGLEYALSSESVQGTALLHSSGVVHLALFEGAPKQPEVIRGNELQRNQQQQIRPQAQQRAPNHSR